MRRRRGGRTAGAGIVALAVAQFALVGITAMLIVAIATGIASRRVGQREAIADARTASVVAARRFDDEDLIAGLDAGDAAAQRSAATIAEAALADPSLVRIKLWSADGRVLFSDESRLVGDVYPLGEDEADALRTGRIEAEVSDLDQPENRFERQFDRLLEVYLPIGSAAAPVLFETYRRYDAVEESGDDLWRSFAPIAIGGLVVLELVQIPLAWSLARRLRDHMREGEELSMRALEASDVERRQIASDLHDGVVQDLTGVAYALSARARVEPDGESAGDLARSAETVRGAVRDLRSLVVDLTPASVTEVGLVAALDELGRRLIEPSTALTLDATSLGPAPTPAASRLVYRAAQEALRNVVRHSGASRVDVVIGRRDDRVVLEVEDDGVGFDPAAVARHDGGHVGLRALRGVIEDAGGSLDVVSSEEAGTRLVAEVPDR